MQRLIVVAACTLLPFAALAQSATDGGTAPAGGDGFGSQTRLWLSTQASGTNAVSEERPMPGEVATLVYQRYLQSFTYAIPERFSSDSFAPGGGNSGGGSGGSK